MTRRFAYGVPKPIADVDRLPGIRAKLKAGAALSERQRQLVDMILYVLETGGDPRVNLGLKRRRGAPRSDRAWYLALDYACRKELLGKAAAALLATSKAWGDSPKTVQDAYTDWQRGVEREWIERARLDVAEYGKDDVYGSILDIAAEHLRATPTRSRKKSRE